ncbi:hypothetical protein SUDANB145_07334 (plasmid) [Streptomyces sp. enrichment culture]
MTTEPGSPEADPVEEPAPVDSSTPPPAEADPGPPPPEPEPEPINPDPEPLPTPDTIAWEPQTWYSATAACATPGCVQQGIIVNLPMLYSNNGDPKYIRVVCAQDGACGKDCTILTATKLDPQPPEE